MAKESITSWKAIIKSTFWSLCPTGTLNSLFNKLDIRHFMALLDERNLGALDFVLSNFSNCAIKELLGVTISTFQGLNCKYFDCTQYSFWQCYVSHCNLAVHVTAQNSNWSQTVLLNVIECHRYSRWLWSLLPNYCGKCNTANDCKLAVNICSVWIYAKWIDVSQTKHPKSLSLALTNWDL